MNTAEESDELRVVFGPAFEGHPNRVWMTDLRSFTAEKKKLAWIARHDDFLIKQLDPIAECESPGRPKIWAPFPLAVMTCISIELLGAYKYGDANADSNRHFRATIEDMDSGFREERTDPEGATQRLSDFVYFGFRHSLVHGFYGKWVFITHDPEQIEGWKYYETERTVGLNIYWFYRRFRELYDEYCSQLKEASDETTHPLRTFIETFDKKFAMWLA